MLYRFQRLELYYPAPLYRYVEYKTFTNTSIGKKHTAHKRVLTFKILHQHYHTTTFSSNLFYLNFNQQKTKTIAMETCKNVLLFV